MSDSKCGVGKFTDEVVRLGLSVKVTPGIPETEFVDVLVYEGDEYLGDAIYTIKTGEWKLTGLLRISLKVGNILSGHLGE